jgi:hypothetical protein
MVIESLDSKETKDTVRGLFLATGKRSLAGSQSRYKAARQCGVKSLI